MPQDLVTVIFIVSFDVAITGHLPFLIALVPLLVSCSSSHSLVEEANYRASTYVNPILFPLLAPQCLPDFTTQFNPVDN